MNCSYSDRRIGDCQEEPFLHWICELDPQADEVLMSYACTKHIAMLRSAPPLVVDDVVQVHEVTEECLHEESQWDLEENRCRMPDSEEEEEPALVGSERPPAYRGR